MNIQRWLYGIYERRLLAELTKGANSKAAMPAHVAIITDGNRRWAKLSGTTTRHGHKMGANKIIEFLGWCDELGIEVVTLYMLSTENLKRSAAELQGLSEIISEMVGTIAAEGKWRVHPVGVLDSVPEELQETLRRYEEETREFSGLHVNVAIGYGGRQEITDAMRSLLLEKAAQGHSIEAIAESVTPEQIGEHLYTKGQPDPDLIIRTSGEQRLSGFLMWQSAYSEFYFCEAFWPAFRRVDFLRAVRSFVVRERRFGV
ncbi:isoprenyl transferase [Saxibacter everestensis]|uniref:Isoprenyl transferase n=1 Tax=Saxibacter everestensis TaxID=2909229 RepID=A0ABY8QPA8_9MICO|nr:isoprenyl transferase [Brevibacteriaceae bacterium ZFBP1038]